MDLDPAAAGTCSGAQSFRGQHYSASIVHAQAAALTLGVELLEMGDGSSSFTQLGGDSLAAIQFARRVDDLCGTHLPVSFVLDHSHSMADVVKKVCRPCRCVTQLTYPLSV